MTTAEKKNQTSEQEVLSIPNVMLEAAGIPPDSDLTVEAIPGVLLIGLTEPLRTANQPLFDLFAAIGIEPEEVMTALEEGGYFDE
ncbi:MAG: hypothetical protein PHE47_10020 [Oscillospiraceae bacterium]|nr:hypothetical protein [Oscillospiraceae bacterium]